MSENNRKNVPDYTQWCDPKRKGPKQRVYRPHSMRQVDACNELNRLKGRNDILETLIRDHLELHNHGKGCECDLHNAIAILDQK